MKSVFTLTLNSLATGFSPLLAFGSRTNGQILNDAYSWAGENLHQPMLFVLIALFIVLSAWGIYMLAGKKKRHISETPETPPEQVIIKKEPVTAATGSGTESRTPEDLPLGRCIVKAAWILGISAIICVLLVLANHQYRTARYVPLDKLTYIDTWTGKCYYSDGRKIE